MPNISQGLATILDNALKSGEAKFEDMDIIGVFQSKDKEVTLYAIAKDEQYIYALLDDVKEGKNTGGFPLDILDGLELKEIFTLPFNAGQFQSTGEKNFKQVDLSYHYKVDQAFRNRIIKLHKEKNQDFIAQNADNYLLNLGFSKGMDSIPVAVKTTNLVSSHKWNESGELVFENITGFMNLPRYLDIITLLPLLSKFCYKSVNIQDMLYRMATSHDNQLVCFRQVIEKRCSQTALQELVGLLQKQEMNPDMTVSTVDMKQFNKVLISLNRIAYERIFSQMA